MNTSSATGEAFEADLRNFITYRVLLRLREDLFCYSTQEGGRQLHVISLRGAYNLEREVVKADGSFEVFLDGVSRAISMEVFNDFSKLFAGPKLSNSLRIARDVSRALIGSIFGYGTYPLVYEDLNRCISTISEVLKKLDDFEEKHYEELKSGYVRIARELLARFADVKLSTSVGEIVRVALKAPYEWITRTGSRKVRYYDLPEEMLSSLQSLMDLALIVKECYGKSPILPAPLLEGALTETPAGSESKPMPVAQVAPISISLKPIKCQEISEGSLPPSREILEGIVAKVLQGLGYSVKVNARLPNRGGGETEVDVWATKGQFKVYVSCKNWNKDVGRSIVEEEFGRILNLRDIPHLKVLVAKSLTEEARRTAVADGFYVVELGAKADAQNSAETCEVLADRLAEIFVSIAPPQLAEAYRRVEEMGRLVVDLSKRIEELKRALGVT